MTNDNANRGGFRPPLLTPAELRVLAALEDLIAELGHAPTHTQLLERLGWRSRGSLNAYLKRLARLGVIAGRGRSLRVIR